MYAALPGSVPHSRCSLHSVTRYMPVQRRPDWSAFQKSCLAYAVCGLCSSALLWSSCLEHNWQTSGAPMAYWDKESWCLFGLNNLLIYILIHIYCHVLLKICLTSLCSTLPACLSQSQRFTSGSIFYSTSGNMVQLSCFWPKDTRVLTTSSGWLQSTATNKHLAVTLAMPLLLMISSSTLLLVATGMIAACTGISRTVLETMEGTVTKVSWYVITY